MIAKVAPEIPKTQRAIVGSNDHDIVFTDNAPVIEQEDPAIRIKVEAVGLNPVDTKLTGDFVTPGSIFGFDCAGTVVSIGKGVRHDVKIGDRVCGCANGQDKARPYGGSLCQCAALHGDLFFKIPDNMSFEEAAGLGLAIQTAILALFWSLKIPSDYLLNPAQKPFPVLVYGASSSVGTMTTQLVKLCGLEPIAVCSPHNYDLVRSYGASAVFDYHTPTCAEDIRKYTKNALAYCVDCITGNNSTQFCYAAIGRAGGKYCAVDPFPDMTKVRRAVKSDWVLATKIGGQPSFWPPPFEGPAQPELLEFAGPVFKILQKLINEGKVRPHPVEVSDGGLKDVLNGVERLRRKEVSGKKLIYTNI